MKRLLLVALAGLFSARAAVPVPAIEAGEAWVRVAPSGRGWEIGNGAVAATLSAEASDGILRLAALENRVTGFNWLPAAASDTRVTVAGETLKLGASALRFDRFETLAHRGGVRLDLHFADNARRFRVVRSYAIHEAAPVVEVWTRITSDTQAVAVTGLNLIDVPLARGTFRWITGHLTPPEAGDNFSSGWVDHEPGQRYDLGSAGRASEQTVPWFAIDRGTDSLFGAYLWSGAWRLDTRRVNDTLETALGSPGLTTLVERGTSLESPHAILGVVSGSLPSMAEASRQWIVSVLRQGRGFEPRATYNTWFTYGTHIDEPSMLAEIEQAAALGAEQFVLDAGWQRGVSADPGDYTAGLGSWEVDRDRFPAGLAPLRDRAHALGMTFGLWVEPERVSIHTINRGRGAAERFLATSNGRYNPAEPQATAAQVCLADAQARQWAAARLFELLDEVRPDLLKWDNNFWLACTRTGHGHGAGDGDFRHVRGLTAILQALRERYPDMRIENCSGGGNRLSFDLLEWTDLGWMDDRSAPSTRVRHHLEGLSVAFPPAYLHSFVMDHDSERLMETADVSWMFRSRMPGALGLSWRGEGMVEAPRELAVREIAIYKLTREITRDAFAMVLTEQVPHTGGPAWDVVQHVSASSGASVVFAFEGAGAPERDRVRLRKLDPALEYDVESPDAGPLGVHAGLDLMTAGIELRASGRSRAHILVLRPIR